MKFSVKYAQGWYKSNMPQTDEKWNLSSADRAGLITHEGLHSRLPHTHVSNEAPWPF